MRSIRLVGILAVLLVTTWPSGIALAGPTPTPTVPSAPSNPAIQGGAVLTWTDNSDNEDGFRITIELVGLSGDTTIMQFEVGPDVTSFALPEEAQASCPDAATINASVVAFNTAGESNAATTFLAVLCPGPTFPPTDAPTPTATTSAGSLPQTGLEDDGGASAGAVVWLLLAGGALAVLGAAWYARRRALR